MELVALILGFLTLVAALLVVPEVRRRLGLVRSTDADESEQTNDGGVVIELNSEADLGSTVEQINVGVASKAYVDEYTEKFSGLTFFELVSMHPRIEKQIRFDISVTLHNRLLKEGFRLFGEEYRRKGRQVRVSIDYPPIPGGEELRILIEDLATNTRTVAPYEFEVDEIGKIRRFSLFASDDPPIDIASVLEDVLGRLHAAYRCVETTLIRRSDEVNEKVFSELYDVIRDRLRTVNKQELEGKYWLILANDDLVLYFFDKDELVRTIDHYKDLEYHGVVGTSPLEMVIAILTETFPFDKSLASDTLSTVDHKGRREYLSLPWADAKYVDDAPIIHLSEVKLYSSDDYSGYVPCICREHYLIVGCPKDFDEDVMEEVKNVENDLCLLFQENLQTWSAYLTAFYKELWTPPESTLLTNPREGPEFSGA